jgi:hypothetical protein
MNAALAESRPDEIGTVPDPQEYEVGGDVPCAVKCPTCGHPCQRFAPHTGESHTCRKNHSW